MARVDRRGGCDRFNVTSLMFFMAKEVSNNELARMIAEGFASVDKRFEHVDKRFDQVDKRFEKVETRLDAVESQNESMRLEMVTQKDVRDIVQESTELITKDLNKIEKNMGDGFSEVIARIDALEERTDEDDRRAFKEIKTLKMTLAKVISHIEKTTGEKVEI